MDVKKYMELSINMNGGEKIYGGKNIINRCIIFFFKNLFY